MTQKAITIKDLAEKLNISVSTVSRALKDNPEISQQTRKTVQNLAKELGYKPNPIAVALKTHKSNTIGVVVPQIVNTFFATVVKKIEEVADKYGYNVLVSSSNESFEKEKKNISVFLANRCDGIILSISKATTSYEHIKQIQEMGIPLVLFDRTTKELDVSKVVADDADAADVLARTHYTRSFPCIVRHGNVWGCQFHPEKSSALGQRILKNFVNIVEEGAR